LKVKNGIILAAGTSSRFAPLSFERHKALTVVKGEVLIERQIEQLLTAGISKIIVVTGYKEEQFRYLIDKYGVKLVHNADYLTRNNNASIWAVKDYLGNSYICSSDNYFVDNPFEAEVDYSYYAAEYSDGYTAEWCMTEDENGFIDSVTIGGKKSWYMLGHAFWSQEFADEFLKILEEEYTLPETADKLWEKIFMAHLNTLKMRIRKYAPGVINEFDTIDELREFDASYVDDTRSRILKSVAAELGIREADIGSIKAMKSKTTEAVGFEFDCKDNHYCYLYKTGKLEKAITF
jgi:CTP:phosphocholine cytidylyltransferase-like protein